MSKHLTVDITEKEAEILKNFCEQEKRTQTDVIRAYIRSLSKKVDKYKNV